MKQASVGVIGHVNHGKTTLVKALTGTDTDRLPDERRRGMSIVLGFAWLPLADGGIDLIDVPGHEQFIRTMVSGATGIDATLLVVNAREGVKPQTVEHLAIADLLGVRHGVVAVTKADLVDEPRRAAVLRELRALLRGTHLEFAPVVFTSAASGEGLAALRGELAALPARADERSTVGAHFWLPVDRVFTLAGHGTVVTGTLRGGSLRSGDAVCCWPHGASGTVRQVQVHNEVVPEALPGQRVGINLRHVRAEDVARGDVLAPPASLRPSVLLDVALRLLPPVTAPELDGRRVRVLLGTTEISAMVRVLEPGANGGQLLAQLRCSRPIVAVAGQRLIVRRESPSATLGGGVVLDPAPLRHGSGDRAAVQVLRMLAGGTANERLLERVRRAGPEGVAQATLAAESRLGAEQLRVALDGLLFVHEQRAWSFAVVRDLQDRIVQALAAFHAAHPLRVGAAPAVCRQALPPGTSEALFQRLLADLAQAGRIVRHDGKLRLADHDPLGGLEPAARGELARIEAMLRDGGMNPPDAPTPGTPQRPLLELLVELGDVLLLPGQPTTQRIALHRQAVSAACGRLATAFPPPDSFTVSQARELLGSTRKFTVPLLQHLHATGRTRRAGDRHMFVPQRSEGGE